MINNNIEKIESLLENESRLKEYLLKIENENIEIPKNLNTKIYSRIKMNSNKIYKYKDLFNVFKVAACAVFALIVWGTLSNFNNENFEFESSFKMSGAKIKVESVVNNFSDILMKPSNLKGGEK